MDRFSTIGSTDGMIDTAVENEGLLELLDLLAKDKIAVIRHFGDRR